MHFGSDPIRMNRVGIVAYGAAITCVALLAAHEAIHPSFYLYENRTAGEIALGVSGWLLATLGPLAMSMLVWRSSRRVNARWLPHLLFFPFAVATYDAGASILYFAAVVPDGDSVDGYTLVPAVCFLVLTLMVHATALVAFGVAKIGGGANVR